jgi:hypothetical protein
MDIAIRDLLTFFIGIIGIAVGYGILKQQAKTSGEDIKKIKECLSVIDGSHPESKGVSIFIKRNECMEKEEETGRQIGEVRLRLDAQHRALKGLQNFARHQLEREKLPLIEINKILNGDS